MAFRSYSQNQEDGILLYLFAVIGTTNRVAVEICAGDGIECNTANLVINHGWTALLVDGDENRVARGREFYARRRETRVWPPTFVHSWVTAENVNDLLGGARVHRRDRLAQPRSRRGRLVDLAGHDAIEPRVVVVEYQDIWGPERAVTVPYDADFRAEFRGRAPDYAGASLAAFVKLGKEKGYRLVGCEPLGFNAFFVRNDVGDGTVAGDRSGVLLRPPEGGLWSASPAPPRRRSGLGRRLSPASARRPHCSAADDDPNDTHPSRSDGSPFDRRRRCVAPGSQRCSSWRYSSCAAWITTASHGSPNR